MTRPHVFALQCIRVAIVCVMPSLHSLLEGQSSVVVVGLRNCIFHADIGDYYLEGHRLIFRERSEPVCFDAKVFCCQRTTLSRIESYWLWFESRVFRLQGTSEHV